MTWSYLVTVAGDAAILGWVALAIRTAIRL